MSKLNGKPCIENVWKALAKYGIKTEEELDDAIKNMEPLNIGCMVSPVLVKKTAIVE